MVRWITDKASFDTAVAGDTPIIIDFTASWCGPCKMIGPIFEQHAGKAGGLQFAKVDVDANEETSAACGIRAMPTFQVWKNGVKQEEFSSADANALQALIARWDFAVPADQPLPGDDVTLHGLVSKPELNGARAIVQPRETWPRSGRITVQPVGATSTMALKQDNMSVETSSATETITPGHHVVVDGLVSKPELNRKRGVVQPGGSNGRVNVLLSTSVTIAAKVTNLKTVRRVAA